VRVVIADDNALVRAGIAALLREAGIDVAAETGSAEELVRAADAHVPDAAIVDVRMPPTQTDEGLRAAHEIRARHPEMAIVVLSEHVEVGVAARALAESPERLGYLVKQRVTDVDEFVATLRRVVAGGSALDPRVVSGLLNARRDDGPLQALTPREREVLRLLAEGLSNQAIAERMVITLRSTEKYVSSIFAKLGLPDTGSEHRRVLAVLRFLRGQPNHGTPVDRPLHDTSRPAT
jgi:DNA-binding NarL/FixJ family response regulator